MAKNRHGHFLNVGDIDPHRGFKALTRDIDFSLDPDLLLVPAGYDQVLGNSGCQAEPDSILHGDYTIYGAYNDLARGTFQEDFFDLTPPVETVNSSMDTGPKTGHSSSDRNHFEGFSEVAFSDSTGGLLAQIPSLNRQGGFDNHNRHSPPLSPGAVSHGTSQPQLVGQPSRESMKAPQQPRRPPRNAEGNYV